MNRSSWICGANAGALFALVVACGGCSSASTSSGDNSWGDDDGDASPSSDGGGGGGDSATYGGDSGTGGGSDSGGAHDGSSTTNADSSAHDAAGSPDASSAPDSAAAPDTGPVTSDDGFGAARTACINEINRLRATQSLGPYTLVNTDAQNMCVDEEATADEAAGVAHQSFGANYPSDLCTSDSGQAMNWGQDECLGYPNTAAGIVQCLDAMWDEKNQSDCTGCVGCTNPNGCANCNFSGTGGQPECGHYVNMSSTWYTSVVCGFAAAPGTWAAQNFFN
jgi:hypothetical protein